MEEIYYIQLCPQGEIIALFLIREEAELYIKTFNEIVNPGTAKVKMAIRVISSMSLLSGQ